MVYFLSKKDSVCTCSACSNSLKMSRVYTLAEILSKIFVKNEEKLGTLFTYIV